MTKPENSMRILAIINLKGGVGKSISAINMAYNLAEEHEKRVLLIDNDKQGNSTKFFGLHDEERPSIAEVLTERGYDMEEAIRKTAYERLDVLPANMNLLYADRQILTDCERPQQTRLKKALGGLPEGKYDFVVIDNAPDLSMSVINALVACHDVMIPIKVDNFAFDGVKQIMRKIDDIREFNPQIRIVGGFVTMYQKNAVNAQGVDVLEGMHEGLPMMRTLIRKTTIVDQATFTGKPLAEYGKTCTAGQDYRALTREYLEMC